MPILLSQTPSGMFQAHDLNFDILCEASDKEKAIKKLKIATEAYIEFGERKGWHDDIYHPAPQKYWDRLHRETPRSEKPPK